MKFNINLFSVPSDLCFSFSQFRVFTAPFHKVGFADFWLADQLNSLSVILMDLEYMTCFYSFELKWDENRGLLPKDSEGRVWLCIHTANANVNQETLGMITEKMKDRGENSSSNIINLIKCTWQSFALFIWYYLALK